MLAHHQAAVLSTTDRHLRIHRFLPLTRVEGPGERACIWVQGCSIRCAGCGNKIMWSKSGGEEICVDTLAKKILDGPPVEGITYLGGEPFEQAAGLARLGKILKKNGLSVLTFTGYLLEDIRAANRPEWVDLLDVTDLLIDGPYISMLTDYSRPWVGSSNQRYHFLTPRYGLTSDQIMRTPNRIEVWIENGCQIRINGMGDFHGVESFFKRAGFYKDNG